MTLICPDYDDVYFSKESGFDETQHVFIRGNKLPESWADRPHTTIAEAGFGTGLNAYVTATLFEETRAPHQTLDFISFEKKLLSPENIKQALEPWEPRIGLMMHKFIAQAPLDIPGFQVINLTPHIRIILVLGDINDTIQHVSADVNFWYLDGFTPAKNPEMWSDTVFENIARLSHPGTSFATFTAAGFVKRGLETVGFNVQKDKGFGHKRDMMTGVYGPPSETRHEDTPPTARKAAIIGAGLAGATLYNRLHEHIPNLTVYEAGTTPASGASGNLLGMINPRLSAKPSPESTFYAQAYAQATQSLNMYQNTQGDIGYAQCGSLILQTDPDKKRRFSGYISELGWNKDHIHMTSAADASALAGITIEQECLYYPQGAVVSPRKVCTSYLDSAQVQFNTSIHAIQKHNGKWQLLSEAEDIIDEVDILVLANGLGCLPYAATEHLPLYPVRGQTSFAEPSEKSRTLKTNLCYSGTCTPPLAEGKHVLGASFIRYDDDTDLRDADHAGNMDMLSENFPAIGDIKTHENNGWAGIRTCSRDHAPVIGKIDDGLYISAAHGSHGIISSHLAADIISSEILGRACPCPPDVMQRISPARFKPKS